MITNTDIALTFASSSTRRSSKHAFSLVRGFRASHINRFRRANGMTEQTLTLGDALALVAWVVGIAIVIIGGLASLIVALALRNADRTARDGEGRDRESNHERERFTDKQASQGELMAGVLARVAQLEDGQSQIAEALNRLTRLEEFRLHAMPKLEGAEETARTVIVFGEQMKTIFRRIDTMTEQMNKLPAAVALELRSMIRPVQGRAANG